MNYMTRGYRPERRRQAETWLCGLARTSWDCQWVVDIPSSVIGERPRIDTSWDYNVVVVAETRSSRIAKTYQEGKERHMNVYVNEELERYSVRLCAVRTDLMTKLCIISVLRISCVYLYIVYMKWSSGCGHICRCTHFLLLSSACNNI